MNIKCIGLKNVSEPITEPKLNIKYMLEGEEASLTSPKKFVDPNDLTQKSADRQHVVCPIFYQCGGCDLLHVKYEAQLKMKSDYLNQLFKQVRYQKSISVIKNPEPLHYRHKVVLSATTVNNKLRLGLYRENTKEVIPFLKCFLHDKNTNEVLTTIEELLNKYKIPAYDIDKGTGILKHILVRKSYSDQSMMIVMVTQGHLLPNAKKIVQDLRQRHQNVVTVIQNIHHKKTHLVLLEDEKIIYGSGFIYDTIDQIKFRLSSRSFYQVNPLQMMVLYQKALDMLNIQSNEIILDTYSGIGTISLLAARKAKEVIAVETNSKAHQDALVNKKINMMDNFTCVNDDVERFMMSYQGNIDGLIMDPTRDGATEKFLNAVIKLKPKKIVYISCEPKTQVRDLNMLTKNYMIKDITAVDMFSQTVHVETITLLSLKTA
ncbi:MAG: 23S rRNA (uracil(1939)-C(5))-methyltransferase RlmD [Acholeplasmataceae bacterium]|jgi:23S rRNA (uracil1939-C5)-methyltransferase|nr:23S rRNA (uracil(1939)-C(5))-methyltransferase RlmD [Acholeplasmataceae bacterium]